MRLICQGFLLQLIKHVSLKLFQIVVFLKKCETENQNKMEIIGVTFEGGSPPFGPLQGQTV